MREQVIQLNHAGASPSSPSVIKAITLHLQQEVELGGYAAAEAASAAIEAAYGDVAALIGARRDEVALTSGGSAAWNAIFTGLELRAGDHIITTPSEYGGAVAAMRARAREAGVHVDVAPATASGEVDLAELTRLITKRTRLISLTWIPTRYGIIEPAEEVGTLARAHDIFFLLDAAQALGQRPINVSALGCDALVACGRKFLRGPRGTGMLFIAPTDPRCSRRKWITGS